MQSEKAATILIVLLLIASPTLALSKKQKPTNKSRSQRPKHLPPAQTPFSDELLLPSVSLVAGPTEYLSGEANVTVKGNENPIIRLGLATSGVTLHAELARLAGFASLALCMANALAFARLAI